MTDLALLDEEPPAKWQLKKLSPMHKQVMSLLAQGLGRTDISELMEITPEYVTMLAAQPLCQAYLREMSVFADAQLEAMSELSAKVIRDTLTCGTEDGKLRAARMQMEVTERIGPNRRNRTNDGDEGARLERLADRLTALIKHKRDGDVIEAEVINVDGPQEAPIPHTAADTP